MIIRLHSIIILSTLQLLAAQIKPTVNAIRTTGQIVIDGYGNDNAWKQANTADTFIQLDPKEGEPATEKTEVGILYDDNNLYFFTMMYDSSPDSIVSRLARRDDLAESDWIGIALDSYHDKQTAFVFIVLASGTKIDELNFDDGRSEDDSWDPVWEVQTRRLSNGWSAEIKIPLSQIRFTEGNDVWGLNIVRNVTRKREESHWSLMRKGVAGFASLFGTLTGMSTVKLPSLLEALPYGVVSSEHYPQTSDRVRVKKINPNTGIDIKYGVSSNFTLDATFNPDFAQVEADPAILNLTQFETFYPEKRPFFIEGTQILRFVTFGGDFGPGLFYSRRIGKPILISPPTGGIITDESRRATILGAAKFSGKMDNGTSIGILTAVTDEEEFTFRDSLGVLQTRSAEPMAIYNLFRIKQDFLETSNIGGIFTGASRNGRYPTYTAGIDWDIKFDSSTFRINGFYARSHILSSTKKLQEGSAGKINVGKISGEWVYNSSFDFTSKQYNINDIGFFRAPNDYGVFGNISYRNYLPGSLLRSYNFGIGPHWRWNYDGLTLFREINANAYTQLMNYWYISGNASYSFGAQDPYEPRGYGIFDYPKSFLVGGEIGTDNRNPIVVELQSNFRSFVNDGRIANNTVAFTFRPTTSMEYQLSLSYGSERNLDRFADAVTDTTIPFASFVPTAVYGKRDVDNGDITLRSTILFTNTLSLQFYNQFFWVQGHYDHFSLLNPQHSLTPYPYTENADFNTTSLNSNIVLRWEYREGSTFFVVWSHGRAFLQNGGYATDLIANVNNTFRTMPNNVYAVKISYWMSL